MSTIGRNLADFIQREMVARTGLRDCRTHGRTWELLRLTRMPTVQVDVGYITNPHDRDLLVSSQARDSIAEGILAAVKRLYLLGQERPAHRHVHLRRTAGPRACRSSRRPAQPRAEPVCSYAAGARADRLLQLRALQQSLQCSLDIGLPAQALLQLEPQPREVPVRCDDLDEPDVARGSPRR